MKLIIEHLSVSGVVQYMWEFVCDMYKSYINSYIFSMCHLLQEWCLRHKCKADERTLEADQTEIVSHSTCH